MPLHNSLKRLSKKQKNSGFTLIELLISSFMGVLVVGAVGFGLMKLLSGSRSNTIQTNKRTEFNRATEFISDEMRRADTIEVDPSAAYSAVGSLPAGGQAVLAINIPGVRPPGVAVDNPIIYFVSAPRAVDAGVWNGPSLIYRYGPPSDANGNFTNGAWGVEPLVDGISLDAATTNCDAGWIATPNPTGFHACILPRTDDPATAGIDESLQGETAQIFAIGQLDESNPNSTNYQVNTQVFARAEQENLDGLNPDVAFTGSCIFTAGALACPGGGSKTFSIERLSDAFACRPDGTKWKVLVSAYFIDNAGDEQFFDLVDSNGNTTNTTSDNVDLATTDLNFSTTESPLFRVTPDTANSPGCDVASDPNVFTPNIQNQNPVNSNDPGFNPQILEDADIIPPELSNDAYLVTDSNNVQESAQQVLTNQGLIDPIQNNKVNTGNDYLVAFEIGQTSEFIAGTNPPLANPGYDFQDQIFRIQVE